MFFSFSCFALKEKIPLTCGFIFLEIIKKYAGLSIIRLFDPTGSLKIKYIKNTLAAPYSFEFNN